MFVLILLVVVDSIQSASATVSMIMYSVRAARNGDFATKDPTPLLERSVGPTGGPLRQSVMLSGNIVNIVRGPGILVLYRRYGLPFYRSMLWH